MIEVKIKLKVKDVEIELTKDEAQELAKVLGGMTGVTIIEKYREFYPERPWRTYPDYPTWGGTNADWICAHGGTFMTDAAHLSDNVSVQMSAQEN